MDQAAIPDFSAGAMENWGLVTYREEYLLFNEDRHSLSRKIAITTVISHEFGHQWFGNLVSPKLWNFLWLNEGFATLFEHLGTDLVHPEWRIFDKFVVSTLQGVLRFDSTITTRSMNQYVESPRAIQYLFDNIAYAKSGSVLRMFLHAFTESSFRKGLNHYLHNHSYQAADENDLFDSLEKAVKEDKALDPNLNVKDIFVSWSNQKGFPLLTVSRNYENGSITISQEKYDTNPQPDPSTWWIPYNFATAKNNIFNDTAPTGWLANFNWTNDEWVIFNRQQTGYYRVLYDPQNYKLIISELNSGNFDKIHPLSRSQILDDINDFVKTGRLPPQMFFDFIAYLKHETEYSPWASAKTALIDMKNDLGPSDKQDQFVQFVAPLVEHFYENFGLQPAAHESHITKRGRELAVSLACEFDISQCLHDTHAEFQKIFAANETIVVENRGLIFKYGIRFASEDDVNVLWIRGLDTTDKTERKYILDSIGNLRNRTLIEPYAREALGFGGNSLSKTEKKMLLISIISGSQSGLSAVIRQLSLNLERVEINVAALKPILKLIAERIVKPETRTEFSDLLDFLEDLELCDEKDIADFNKIIDEKWNWLDARQKNIGSCIPQYASSGTSYLVASPAIPFILFISYYFS